MTQHLLQFTRSILIGLYLVLFNLPVWSASPPDVVTSIAPIYNLTLDIMAGIGQPTLIVSGFNSPHNYRMRPSNAQQLASADLILWIGKNMEYFLRRPLQNYRDSARIVTLIDTPELSLLPYNQHNAGSDHSHFADTIDTHIWLNPDNAVVLSKAINQALAQVDPDNATHYQKNTTKLIAAIEQFSNKAKQSLSPVTTQAFMVYHDAYQYFTQFFALKQVAYVVLDPGRQPSAKQISLIRKQLKTQNVRCIFTEPQFITPILKTLTKNVPLRTATLDPLGVQHAHKHYGYIAMMEANVKNILKCLK